MLPASYYTVDSSVSPCISADAFCKSTSSYETVTDCASFSAGVLSAVSAGYWKHSLNFTVNVRRPE